MAFRVAVENSDIAFPCESNESVLDAAQRGGFEIPFSCRKGVCGTCKGRIVSGEVRAFGGDALGAADKAAGHVLFCNARPRSDLVIAPRSIAKADPFARKIVDARVFRLRRVANDVMHVHLRFPAGIRIKFKAGQHLNLLVGNGERRDFSFANPPRESDGAQLHIRHVPGGAFTSFVFNELRQGDWLKLEAPFGDFTLQESDRPIIFLAGSTGFAPVQSIIEDMILRGTQRPVSLYWGARRADGLYSHRPERWAKALSNFTYVPVLSEETVPGLRHGLVHQAVLDDHPRLDHFQVYACGVPVMVEAARAAFTAAGLPSDAFFADSFVTRADVGAAGP